MLTYPDQARALVSDDNYAAFAWGLVIIVPVLWAGDLGLILTSPEQEVRFAQWSKRWRKTPLPFEAIPFDTEDPDYRVPA